MAEIEGTVAEIKYVEEAAVAEPHLFALTELELSGFLGSLIQQPFDPVAHSLDATFRLTNYAELKAVGCKVPQDTLANLLAGIKDVPFVTKKVHRCYGGVTMPYIGIGLGASVTPLRHAGLCLVQTTDFFYPLVDDPYIQGKIACAAVLSNLYAMGVTECDNMLMLMTVSIKLTDQERDVVVPLMMRGFKDAALQVGTTVTGGQTVMNPWMTIGGTATSICQLPELMIPENAVAGDVLVLTKPLGTQIAAILHQWQFEKMPERRNRLRLVISEEDVGKAYVRAIDSMTRTNRAAAILMRKYEAHAAIDITGFGLLGHAQSLAQNQKADVSFVIHNLPVIAKLSAVSKAAGKLFPLMEGKCPETSGGLLICLAREQAVSFCKDIEKQEGHLAWIVGIVEKGDKTARIINKPRIIEVPIVETDGKLW